MARPTTIRDEDILAAAREVFLEHGIRATSADVAERAGVSEGILFKRFQSKERLFHAAMRVETCDADWIHDLVGRAGSGDVRANLRDLCGTLLEMFRRIMPLMIMSWSNREAALDVLREKESPPFRVLGAVMAYLSAEMAFGRIAQTDAEILARCLVGSVQNYVFFEALLRARNEPPTTPQETFVQRLVDALWTGIAPREPATAEPPRPRAARRRAR